MSEGAKIDFALVNVERLRREPQTAILNEHRHLHGLAKLGEVDCAELERIHKLVVDEMTRRGLEHNSPLECGEKYSPNQPRDESGRFGSGGGGSSKREELESLRQKIQSRTHSLDDVANGKYPVGVEGRGGKDIIEAKQRGMFTTEVRKVPIYALNERNAQPLVKYLNSGGQYGTPEFSRLLGYSKSDIQQYEEFLKLQSEVGNKAGLKLNEPHAYLVWKGKKKSIALPSDDGKGLDGHLVGVPLVLCQNGAAGPEAYGEAILGNPAAMTPAQFDLPEYADCHCVRPEERREWWDGVKQFYVYPIKSFAKYEHPRPVLLQSGCKCYLPDVRFKQYQPPTDKERAILAQSEKLPKQIILTPRAVSLTGSMLYGNHEPRDVDMVVVGAEWREDEGQFVVPLTPTFKEKLERVLRAVYQTGNSVQYISEHEGPTFDHLPLYALALVRLPRLEVEHVSEMEPEMAEVGYDKDGVKFNPNQPRDAAGRFGSEGSSNTYSSLSSMHSKPFKGEVYRAVNSTSTVKKALGPGTYFSPSKEVAQSYGSDVRKYEVDLGKVLGTNSPEFDKIQRQARAKQTGEKPLATVINELAREQGFDGIYGGETFGLAIFERGNFREVEGEKTLTATAVERELRGATLTTRRQALQSYTDDAILPGRPFVPLKPMRPAKEGQRQVFSRFADYVESLDSWPEYVSAKRDGMRVTFHRKDGKVTAYSDDGKDTTDTLPELVKRLEEIKGGDFVLDSEVERWDNEGQHYPREAASGAIHSGEGTADLIANVFDVLYWDGKDLHKQPFVERLKVLNALPADTKSDDALRPSKGLLNVIPHYPVKDRVELEKLCMRTAYKPGVEGVVVKRADGDYPLDGDPGANPVWVKFHKSAAFNVVVLEAIETKVPGVFNFVYGIPAGDAKPAEPFELDGKTYMIIGKTFSSSEQHKVRDEIEVESETVNFTQNEDGTVEVSFWVPTIIKSDGGEKYSPNQPRDESGRFGSGAGGSAGRIHSYSSGLTSDDAERLEGQIDDWDGSRYDVAQWAIDDGKSGNPFFEKQVGERTVAVMSMSSRVSEDWPIAGEKFLPLNNLATAERGHGTEMVRLAATEASKRGVGLSLESARDAIPFYQKLGMNQDGRMFWWSKDETSKFAKGEKATLDELEPDDGVFTKLLVSKEVKDLEDWRV